MAGSLNTEQAHYCYDRLRISIAAGHPSSRPPDNAGWLERIDLNRQFREFCFRDHAELRRREERSEVQDAIRGLRLGRYSNYLTLGPQEQEDYRHSVHDRIVGVEHWDFWKDGLVAEGVFLGGGAAWGCVLSLLFHGCSVRHIGKIALRGGVAGLLIGAAVVGYLYWSHSRDMHPFDPSRPQTSPDAGPAMDEGLPEAP